MIKKWKISIKEIYILRSNQRKFRNFDNEVREEQLEQRLQVTLRLGVKRHSFHKRGRESKKVLSIFLATKSRTSRKKNNTPTPTTEGSRNVQFDLWPSGKLNSTFNKQYDFFLRRKGKVLTIKLVDTLNILKFTDDQQILKGTQRSRIIKYIWKFYFKQKAGTYM